MTPTADARDALAEAADRVLQHATDGNLPWVLPALAEALDQYCAALTDDPAAALRSRFQLALDIVDPGACNPSGIAHALIEACRSARDDGVSPASDAAVRLIVTQLAWVCRADSSVEDYGALLTECRRRLAEDGTPNNQV
jgi:hypothetical protein